MPSSRPLSTLKCPGRGLLVHPIGVGGKYGGKRGAADQGDRRHRGSPPLLAASRTGWVRQRITDPGEEGVGLIREKSVQGIGSVSIHTPAVARHAKAGQPDQGKRRRGPMGMWGPEDPDPRPKKLRDLQSLRMN